MPKTTHKFHERASRIEDDLRQAIVRRLYEPGDRIPTRDELTERYGVSKVTVQRALQALTDKGFLVPRGTRGTFIAHNSPHLSRYFLMLPEPPQNLERNQAWNALAREARQLPGDKEFIFHFRTNDVANLKLYQTMLDDVASNRVAGIIFAESPFLFSGTPLLTQPGIPRTAISSKPYKDVPAIYHDYPAMISLSLRALHDAGSRRPAMLMVPGLPGLFSDGQLARLFTDHGMQTPEHWFQAISVEHMRTLENLVRLLFDYPPQLQPDGLLISNDNFVEPVTRALVALGLENLPVIAECNFPYPTPAHMPVIRIGFSIPECLRLCMHNIDLQRKGQTPPPQQSIPAICEDDMPAIHPPQWLASPTA